VDSADRAARAARLAGEVAGVQRVVNNLQIASASPSSTVVVTPAPTTVVTAPSPVVTTSPSVVNVPEQPPIDASGVVARYDAQTGTLTFQDGRVVRITSTSGVWGPASTGVLQPGAQVHVHNAVPVGYQPTPAPSAGVSSWRMGSVNRVDQASGLIYLNDGSVVHVGPSTSLVYGSRRIPLAEIQPGAQIAIGMPGTSASTAPASTATTVTSGSSVSALPRQVPVPIESPQVHVIVVPQAR
jgi:hypothetical protein